MTRGLGDNPLSRKRIEEFPGSDLNLKGLDRVLYETRGPIPEDETEQPASDGDVKVDNNNSNSDSNLGEKIKQLFE